MPNIPNDCVLIPTQKGALLVSPSYGLYCAVMNDEIDSVRGLLEKSNPQNLSDKLQERLKNHGFYGQPRPFKTEDPLLQFQVTNACNLHCVYCAVRSGKARDNEITLDDVKRVIDETVAIYPNVRFSFTGGEPLLVPWLFDAISYACQHSRQQVGLLSNLLLIKDNQELFEKIVQFVHDGHQLRMSISAIDREACNRLSGKDCYGDAIEIIQKLNKVNALPYLDVPLSAPDSRANIEAFPEFRRSVPIIKKLLFAKMYIGGRENGKHVFASSEDEENMLDDLVFEGGTCIDIQQSAQVTYRKKGCACEQNEYLCVRSDGAVFSCFRLMGEIGHISEGIKAIIDRRHKTPFATDLEPCRSCPFVYLCASGCKTDKLIYQETHKTPVCGLWRKKLVAEMLFEDKPYFFEWPMHYLLSEAHRRGLDWES